MSTANHLLRLANLWTAANSRSLSRLATIVANDGKLFERVANGGSCTLATYDRFIAYFADNANWRGGIPAEVIALLPPTERAAA